MNRKIGIILSVICILCLTPLPRFNVINARMIWKLYASIDTNKSYWNICWGKHNTVYLWIIRGRCPSQAYGLRVKRRLHRLHYWICELRHVGVYNFAQFSGETWIYDEKKCDRDSHWFSVELKGTSWILKDFFETFFLLLVFGWDWGGGEYVNDGLGYCCIHLWIGNCLGRC